MAELFGTVASAVSVVELVVKLSALYGEVKDGPETIRHSLDRLRLTSIQLKTIADQASIDPIAFKDTGGLDDCLALCECSVAVLKPVVEELQGGIAKSHKFGSLRVVLRKATLDKYRKNLDEALTSLQLAYSMFITHVQQHNARQLLSRQSLLLREVNNQGQIQSHNSQVMMGLSGVTSNRLASVERTVAAMTISSDYYSRTKRPRPKNSLQYEDVADLPPDFRLARLWLGHVLLRSFQGWKAHLGFWAALPCDAPQILACLYGDLESLKELYRARKATPFDREAWGSFSCLHLAFQHSEMIEHSKRAPLASFLLDQGADATAVDNKGWDMMYYFMNYMNGTTTPRQIDETMLSILRRLIEINDPDCEGYYRVMCQKDYRYPQFFPIIREAIWPPMSLRPLSKRLAFAFNTDEWERPTVKLYVYLAVASHDRYDDATLSDFLPHFMTLMAVFGAAAAENEHAILFQMRELLGTALRAGLDLSLPRRRPGYKAHVTALDAFLSGYGEFGYGERPCYVYPGKTMGSTPCEVWLQSRFQIALRIWVDTLDALGVDLEHYGRQERALSEPWHRHFCSRPHETFSPGQYFYTVESFEFGPRAADWVICVSEATDEIKKAPEPKAVVVDVTDVVDDTNGTVITATTTATTTAPVTDVENKVEVVPRISLPGAWIEA